jgi:UPF0176 protein
MTDPIKVVALYRFAAIADCEPVQAALIEACGDVVRGILLVAPEGINGTIAGPDDAIDAVVARIRKLDGLAELELKVSSAETMPFHRMKVRIKREIVTMGLGDLDPSRNAGTYVAPEHWNALIARPDTVVIDTRNDYETNIGVFRGAIRPNTRTFRDFPDWYEREGRQLLDRPTPPTVAMYCTGGIRCEKATAFLKSQGVADVRHLHGGILKYLETTPEQDSLWDGECFVFDERVALGHGLTTGTHSLCRGCRMPLSAADRTSPHYVEGVACARCHDERSQDQKARYAERKRQMDLAEERGEDHIGADRQRPVGNE